MFMGRDVLVETCIELTTMVHGGGRSADSSNWPARAWTSFTPRLASLHGARPAIVQFAPPSPSSNSPSRFATTSAR
nr:hypothetical protein CFP56_09631 [Quercus suber]